MDVETVFHIESRMRAHLEKLVLLMHREGKSARLAGVTLLNEGNDFILGALVHAAYRLWRTGEGEEKRLLFSALSTFFAWTEDAPCGTWGKMSLLSVLCDMKERGELSLLSPALLTVLRKKTDIGDFYDRSRHELIGKAANYLHVAATCISRRAKLGWETEDTQKAVTARLLAAISSRDACGFLDDEPPEGRFDSYTFMVMREIPDQCAEAGIAVPEAALSNLRTAATAFLKMANARGDGFVYGRSLSVYGDTAPIGLLLSAMKRDLLTEEEKKLAYAYILAILDKLSRFWYDEKRGIFNIWFDGRATDGYREVHRLLEVNLGIGENILNTVEDLTSLGLWGETPIEIPSPATWEAHTVSFLDTEDQKAAAVILRYKDTLAMLPLVGSGSVSSFAKYLPFPGIAGVLEAAPQSYAPYLVPEYKKDGEIFRPIQYYTSIRTETTPSGVRVTAEGNLAHPSLWPSRPTRTHNTFLAEYLFEGDIITASFQTDLPFDRVRMQTATTGREASLRAFGFARSEEIPLGKKDTMAPHGAYTSAFMHTADSAPSVGWRLTLSRE